MYIRNNSLDEFHSKTKLTKCRIIYLIKNKQQDLFQSESTKTRSSKRKNLTRTRARKKKWKKEKQK